MQNGVVPLVLEDPITKPVVIYMELVDLFGVAEEVEQVGTLFVVYLVLELGEAHLDLADAVLVEEVVQLKVQQRIVHPQVQQVQKIHTMVAQVEAVVEAQEPLGQMEEQVAQEECQEEVALVVELVQAVRLVLVVLAVMD